MFKKYKLDWFLGGLSLVCAALMFVSSSDPMLSSLRGTPAQSLLTQFPTGNQIVFDLSVGVIASVFMFFLVVRIPELAKRRRVRQHLARTYDSFKEECIAIFLGSFQSSYSLDLVQELKSRERFRAYFTESHSESQERWHAVANGLDERRIKTLVVELEILMNEVHFALSTVDVSDPKVFAFFKHLSRILYRSKNWTAEYDDVKSILRFMWSLHTGWDWTHGYVEKDIVAEMIAAM